MKIKWLAKVSEKFKKMTFSKSLLTGIAASCVDMSVLFIMIKGFHIEPKFANFPGLICGSTVQFLGNRNFAFKAQGGDVKKQVRWYILCELCAMSINGGLFYLLTTYAHLFFAVARPISALITFSCFSFPMWKKHVFNKTDSKSDQPAPATP